MQKLELLFEPLRVRGLTLKNRLVMPPMHTALAAADGKVTQRLIDYYERRAEGGVALIIQEATSVRRDGACGQNWTGIWDDGTLAGWQDLVAAVHRAGAKIAIQLHHGGGVSTSAYTGTQPLAPWPWSFAEQPRILTVPEIVALEDAFAEGASRAIAAGYDAIELHGAHGYLISQFMSPLSNKRPDEYGGDLDGRLRFARNVIAKVRRVVGPAFPIAFRMGAEEFLPGGITLAESQIAAPKLVEAGVDIVHVSGGRGSAATIHTTAPMEVPQGNLLHLAEGIKRVVDVPVIAVGRIADVRLAEDVLRTGKADLVAMGRALIADPDLPRKAQEGRLDDIRPCIGCHQGCRREGSSYFLGNLTCLSNPAVGREREMRLAPAAKPAKVVVVGGGPGGLEAARVAAERGHNVTLFERDQLGGKLRSGTIAPGKQDVGLLIDHLAGQAQKLGVDIRRGELATKDTVQASAPDAVILAVGGEPIRPELPGLEHAVLAEDVLLGRAVVGRRVVVMGGGMTGCEVAEYLASQGKQVTIVTRIRHREDMASDLPQGRRGLLFERLRELGVEIQLATNLQAVEMGRARVGREGEQLHYLPADDVVLAQGYRPRAQLAAELATLGIPVYIIGDAKECRTAKEAIREGAETAHLIGG